MSAPVPFCILRLPVALLTLLLSTAVAGAARSGNWAFSLHLENDLFADTDAQYTNGLKFTASSPDLNNYFHDRAELPDWARARMRYISRYIPFIKRKDATRTLAFPLGQNIYTPEDITQQALIGADRLNDAGCCAHRILRGEWGRWCSLGIRKKFKLFCDLAVTDRL